MIDYKILLGIFIFNIFFSLLKKVIIRLGAWFEELDFYFVTKLAQLFFDLFYSILKLIYNLRDRQFIILGFDLNLVVFNDWAGILLLSQLVIT